VALEKQNKILRKQFPEGPTAAATAPLQALSEELSQLALELAKEFSKRGKGEYEEHAWRLRSKAICTAHSFERHRVGPAMLDWADCSLRLGKREAADAIYTAIIKDFTELIRSEPQPTWEWLTGLQCLERALEGHSKPYEMLIEKTRESLALFGE